VQEHAPAFEGGVQVKESTGAEELKLPSANKTLLGSVIFSLKRMLFEERLTTKA
jgi:hypothetical protein